ATQEQNEGVPRAIEQKRTIANQAAQDRRRSGKIRQRKQVQACRDYVPDTESQNGGRKNRPYVAHPFAQRWPEPLRNRENNRDAKNFPKEQHVRMRLERRRFLCDQQVSSERN